MPLGRGEGFKFINGIKGGSIPAEYIPPIEKGIIEAMEKGVLLGYPMVDLQVTLYDGCLLYTSPSPRDRTRSRMPSSA